MTIHESEQFSDTQMSCDAVRLSRSTPSRTVSSVVAVAVVSCTEHLIIGYEFKKEEYRHSCRVDVHRSGLG